MSKKAIVILAIVAILATAMLVGCIEKDTLPISNSEFKNITADACDDIAYQLEDIEAAKDNGDFATAKIELAAFDMSVRQYITEFEEMGVTENAVPCKKAIIIAFEESRLLGVYFEGYLENPSVDEYARYNAQAINVTNQMEIAAMLARDI